MIPLLIVILVVLLFCGWFYLHQQLLKDRAHLMREAIRNEEFTFRLPLKGLFWGERALQQALNQTGQDIASLLARNEVEAWQRLTRVLTHEIMNATTPITSISQAYLESSALKGTAYEEGIRAIYDTTRGLSLFVESYRKLAELQEPVITEVALAPFVEGVKPLYADVEWDISIPSTATMSVDEQMLRQVMINLVKNACEAGATRIDVRWRKGLYISNNGAAIPPELRQEIFVPFFTTKARGSGIGLSLSRQMMIRQGYDLRLAEWPDPGNRVTFVIV